MFSPALTFGQARFSANLYHQVGVETGVASATPHALTMMLIDGFIKAVKQSRVALGERRIEDKGRHISHAARILDEGLKAALDLDRGGDIARNLHDLYDYCQVRLLHANLRNDDAALDEVLRLMQPVRDGWAGIGPVMPT